MYTFLPKFNDPEARITYDNFLSENQIEYVHKNLLKIPYENANVPVGKVADYRRSRVKWLPFDKTWSPLYKSVIEAIQICNSNFWRFDLKDLREPLQYTEYHASENGKYDWHMDIGQEGASHRKISVTIQLSHPDEYEGGDLELFKQQDNISHGINTNFPTEKISKGLGTAVFFPSYILHRVTPVTKGVRKSLVLWAGGVPFK